MGNYCCPGIFARVPSPAEMNQMYPNQSYNTRIGIKTGDMLKQAELTRMLSQKLGALTVLNVIYFVITVVLAGFISSLIPGYSSILDPSGTGTRVPHTIWFIWSAITVFMFTMSFYFGPYFHIKRFSDWSKIYFFAFLVPEIFQMIVHLIFVVIELVEVLSGMATNTTTPEGFTYLIILIVFIGLALVLDIVTAVVATSYMSLIDNAMQAGWKPGVISSQQEGNGMLLNEEGSGLVSDDTINSEKQMIGHTIVTIPTGFSFFDATETKSKSK